MLKPKKKRKRKVGVRTRAKNPVTFKYENRKNGSSVILQSAERTVYLDRLTDNYSRPCNLYREVYTPASGFDETVSGFNATYENIIGTALNPTNTWSWAAPYCSRLKWNKLPTSNGADILTNIAEFDDTLLMVSKNIRKSASYGGYQWGWAPLVSDIMAVNDAANSVKNSLLEGNRRTAKYRVNDTFTVTTPPLQSDIGLVRHKWDVTVKYRGAITIENDILSFYDYMGFHPSPKLLWDLVPLSFAVDYILPIGDMLKQLTPHKGWVKAANFTGWRVIDAKVTESLVEIRPDYVSVPVYPGARYVDRSYLNGVSLEQRPISATIEALKTPTWQQVFDLTYLAEAFYNTGRKLVSPHVYRKTK